MSERECPVCHAKVAGNKAFCPDCGAPLEQEEKRETLSSAVEMDKTFNLKGDDLQQMLREMNLAAKPDEMSKTQSIVIAPEAVREIKPAAENVGTAKSSNKLFYLFGALILLILLAGLICLLLFVFRHQIFAI